MLPTNLSRRAAAQCCAAKPRVEESEFSGTPTESFASTGEVSGNSSNTGHGAIKFGPDGPLKQAIQTAGTILSGVASYFGITRPVTARAARGELKPLPETCPCVMTILEDPCMNQKEEACYQALNRHLTGQYETLDQVFADPDRFRKDIEARFEAQKSITPEDPYAFDFSDYGVPVLKQIGVAVDKEIKELHGEVGTLRSKRFKKKDVREREVGLQYLSDLKGEISERVRTGDLSYRRLQELGYFASCILGHFDMEDIHMRDRLLLPIDSYLQSEEKVGIEEEYRRYKDNDFTIHQKKAHAVSGFDKVERTFEEAYFNPERLEMINLPTMEPLDQEPFMRLMNKDIFLAGVAADPLSADGFVRQGRLFWLHDVRHNSAIFAKKKQYELERNLTPLQKSQLDRRIDVWNTELFAAMGEIEDPQLASAVDTVVFNIHHDRGLPLVPSTYDNKEMRPVTKALRFMWGVSGQDTKFDQPRRRFKEAYAWVDGFFKERRDQEKALTGY